MQKIKKFLEQSFAASRVSMQNGFRAWMAQIMEFENVKVVPIGRGILKTHRWRAQGLELKCDGSFDNTDEWRERFLYEEV